MHVNEHIAAIIGKKLEGQASAEELAQLASWLTTDAGNALEYDQLARIWAESPRVLARPAFDTAAAWARIDGLISGSSIARRPAPVKSIALSFRRAAVAAAVIAVAATGWWWLSRPHWERLEATKANKSVQLPDGSVVLLRKGSQIEYPRVFANNERTVHLTGEAFFNVQHQAGQPFRITSPHLDVEVLGTSFLVRSANDASNDAIDEVVVSTGKVSVTDRNNSANHAILMAGQKAVLQEKRLQETPVADSNYMAWKTGILEFKGATLEKALADIAHYYEVPLSLAPGQGTAATIRINARFENQPFERVLEELGLLTGLEVKKESGKYLLFQK